MTDHWNNPPEDEDGMCPDCGIEAAPVDSVDLTVYTCPDCGKQWTVPHDQLDDEIDLGEPTEE